MSGLRMPGRSVLHDVIHNRFAGKSIERGAHGLIAIAHGRSILAVLAAGADMTYVGSAFLTTQEAHLVPEHQQMVLDSGASDVVCSNYFTGIHGNYLRSCISSWFDIFCCKAKHSSGS